MENVHAIFYLLVELKHLRVCFGRSSYYLLFTSIPRKPWTSSDEPQVFLVSLAFLKSLFATSIR
jgi:hypothetical protein